MKIRPFVESDEARAGLPQSESVGASTNTGVIWFYRSLGYAVDEAVAMGKRLIPDEPK